VGRWINLNDAVAHGAKMIKYRTLDGRIEAHEVLQETDKMVVLAPKTSANSFKHERKEAKRSDWQNWHDTWGEAKLFLIEDVQKELDALRLRLGSLMDKFNNIKGMVGPNAGLTGRGPKG
jgi:tryptophanyl-tRNA synthetase